ncbi:MAG: hypothetical protein ACI4JQ_06280 [Ruminococcus sp.]
MKKFIRTLSAVSACAALAAAPFSAQAASEYSDTSTYTNSIQLERYAMTAEEAASGDGSIHLSAYIKGRVSSDIAVSSAQNQLIPDDSGQIYFRNVFNPIYTYTENTYSYLGGTFTTSYRPFCFGNVSDSKYSTKSINAETRDYCVNPISGTLIYYNGTDDDGNPTITFKLHGRYFVDENGNVAQDSVTHNIVCPLTLHEDGSATYTFQYADIYYDHVEVGTSVGTIPYFQQELLSVGDKIAGANDIMCWIGDVRSYSTFLGNSDDFPLMETDVHLKKDTPCGIYNITLNQSYCEIAVDESGSSRLLPLKYEDAAIAVGVEQAVGTTVSAPEYACYYAENNKTITANSMGAKYTCDVSFTDGTQQQLDVTNAVNAGTSPEELYKNAEQSLFIGNIPMYCGDTAITDENNQTTQQTILVGKKGDANLDGIVTIDDASTVLRYYAASAAGLDSALTEDAESQEEILAYFLGDTDTQSQTKSAGGVLDIKDASNILTYYASIAAGIPLSWDTFL